MKLGLCLSGGGIKGVAHIGAIKALEEKGINASVIGIITSDKNRVLINGDETRFLEPQRGDEIYKLF